MTATGMFSAPLTSTAPAEAGQFAPLAGVELPPVVPMRLRSARVVRRHGLTTVRALTAAVGVLLVAAVLSATAISYGALTLGSARITSTGTMIPPLAASMPINALPAGTVVTATPGQPVKVGVARLLQPALGDTAQLLIVGPISAGVGLAGYAARCVAGSCDVGADVTIRLDEIAGAADSGVSAWQWFTRGGHSG